MKRLFAIFLLMVFLFNILGYYLVFSYNQYILRREMMSLVKSQHFDRGCALLRISELLANRDFRRLNPGEFRYRGVLYDIVSEEHEPGILIFRCIADSQEDNLIAGFSRSQEFVNSQGNAAAAKHGAAMLYHVITLALVETSRNLAPQFPSEIKFAIQSFPVFSIPSKPVFPPPERS
ncbi:MAG: hypothetical protein WCK34_06675 [Bacteroidota bacterium]